MLIPWTLHGMLLPQVTEVVCNYFAFECGVRNLAPDSIKGVYIPGVVNLFISTVFLPPPYCTRPPRMV